MSLPKEQTEPPPPGPVENAISAIGRACSWMWLVLAGVIVVNVVLRYVFDQGLIQLEELQWHIYAVVFMVGLSYTYNEDSHIRVDIFYDHFPPKLKNWIELIGLTLFMIPLCLVLIYYGIIFAKDAFEIMEASSSPGGLPYRWIIKSILPLAFVLFLISILIRILKCLRFIFSSNQG